MLHLPAEKFSPQDLKLNLLNRQRHPPPSFDTDSGLFSKRERIWAVSGGGIFSVLRLEPLSAELSSDHAKGERQVTRQEGKQELNKLPANTHHRRT